MDVEFSQGEVERYLRQLALTDFGSAGQSALKQARVLVVGARSSGAAASAQLASAGVGYIGIADGGKVGLADLPGQALHYTPDVGVPKSESAAAKLGVLNPEVQVDSYPVDITADNCDAILIGHDLIVSCDQSRATRRLVNDATVAAGVPLIDCGAGDRLASLQFVAPGTSVCLACAIDREPDFGPALPGLAATVGSFAALEAVKALTGWGEHRRGRLLLDSADGSVVVEDLTCSPDCNCVNVPVGAQTR